MRNDFEEEPEEEDNSSDRTILYKNFDANVDPHQIPIEKQIQKLPESLQFIKEYIYFSFLPSLDNTINELEKIKDTPIYDENALNLRPTSIRKQKDIITCIDSFGNSNIKHAKISKIVYGTSKGNIYIYDIEADKILIEKNISKNGNRVDFIATATTKYFDTYLSRIAVNCRSEIFINIFSYNHSFSSMSLDSTLNTVNPNVPDPIANEELNLSYVISGLFLSKDSYYLGVKDYAGGVRIFKFNDIPSNNPTVPQETQEKKEEQKEDKETPREESKNPKKERKGTLDDPGKEKKPMKSESSVGGPNPNMAGGTDTSFIFIKRIECEIKENMTILPNGIGNINEANAKANNSKDTQKNQKKPAADNKKNAKGNTKDNKDTKEPPVIDESLYNIKTVIDDTLGDSSIFQKYNKFNPLCHFVQRKFIYEEKGSNNYISSTVTVGLYVAFENTCSYKYISLYPYLTEKMKATFKVTKTRMGGQMTAEDTLALNSQLKKKEKEFLAFIRSKLENNNQTQILSPNLSSIQSGDVSKVAEKSKTKEDKDTSKTKKENKSNDSSDNTLSDMTKSEISFNTLFPITALGGQKSVSSQSNLIGLGMMDGSILVWDCELHVDKYLLQKNSRFEVTSISIDTNYLFAASRMGQIYIYDLMNGNETYTSFHNPYVNSPVSYLNPFFPCMVLGIDLENKFCVYNTKRRHKISKFNFIDIDDNKIQYNISYFNQYQISSNEEFIALICEKDNSPEYKNTSLDMIKYQKERNELLRNKPNDKETDFFNVLQLKNNPLPPPPKEPEEEKEEIKEPVKETKDTKGKKEEPKKEEEKKEEEPPELKLELKEKYLIIYKIKDLLVKCYPNLAMSVRSGLSLRKLIKKDEAYTSPIIGDTRGSIIIEEDQSQSGSTQGKGKGSLIKLSPAKERKDKILKENVEDLKKNLIAKPKSQMIQMEDRNYGKEEKKVSNTQQKDIYYNSFKNFQKRYEDKERRENKIKLRNEKIMKELL
ncbi:MAG: hypothetical protein MJ252_17060, partial [archaeon]|nr:hypothetical protein [archaeon]